ncbi:hypothetical protein SAMN04490248_106144 [Salinihabitans flavidus]|uniref:Uncharacterized protein n=1 Tax=Salinihabitans flavidus TaxID=569882 RepID=A0A1H8QG02_9RHOB|nr:hypothetical protein [Salinihabitans flavidus]SEO52948.1 hypothetical protein SAMN04490248_106144 [Salinihabitans flavidus]
MTDDPNDPRGLIREAYRIEGIDAAQCRSIFLDWALRVPEGQDTKDLIAALLERYGAAHPDHPMTGVLRQGLDGMPAPRRRGGWRSRSRSH